MATAAAISSVPGLFKKSYGNIPTNLVPAGNVFQEDLPMDERKRVGESYVECVVLSHETGVTFGGSSAEVVDINPAIAGVVKQAELKDYQMILGSVIPFQTLSRSAEKGQQAFESASKHVVKNNLKSHHCFLEIALLYGQSDAGLGYVSYTSATYRGVAFTNGAATLNSIVFATGGVDTTNKHILLAPGSFAAGVWTGMDGVKVKQIATSDGSVVGSGKLVAVNSEYGYVTVDFTPTAATSATSHKLVFDGWENSLEMPGIFKIMQNTGTLFSISATTYPLWKASSYAAYSSGTTAGKLTFAKLQKAVAVAVNRAGLDTDVTVYVNPRSWETLLTEQAGLKSDDSSYSPEKAERGQKAIRFYSQNGLITVKASRHMKEGFALVLDLDTWSRFGSASVSFKVPGTDMELILPLTNQTGWSFRSYSSQCVLCSAPARNVLVTDINDEAAS
ncbi:MAG TPA: hypothetical protein VEB22_12335 [Phycisphaerales bacterium]|nr:hypothetical protein [Phycisphaerales bacterium]